MGLPNIGPLELIIILAIALLIVGPGRLPEMGSAIGRTIREFRKASSDITDTPKVESSSPARSEPRPNTLSDQATPNQPAPASKATASEPAPAQASGEGQAGAAPVGAGDKD